MMTTSRAEKNVIVPLHSNSHFEGCKPIMTLKHDNHEKGGNHRLSGITGISGNESNLVETELL